MKNLFTISAIAIFLLIAGSCSDNQIDPFEDKKGVYSIYGAMDLHETKHVIRVRDLRTFLRDSTSKHLDAIVTFSDLTNNTSQVLKDSVVQFPANFTHNFILNKEFTPSSPYRVDVERSDGIGVSSVFTTPGITETELVSNNDEDEIKCYTEIKMVFKNVKPGEQVRVEFGIMYQEKMYWVEFTGICVTEYFEDRYELVITAKPYLLLDLIWPKPGMDPPPNCRDYRYPTVLCDDLDTGQFVIRYKHLGPEWERIYPVKPTIPDEVGDVENGLGFLGAFREDTLSFISTNN